MQGFPFRGVYRVVPEASPQIDWSHPVSRGLIACYLPGLTGGQNIVPTPDSTLASESATQVASSPEGRGLKSVQINSGMMVLAPAPFRALPLSFYWRGFQFGQTSGGNPGGLNPMVIGVSFAAGFSSPFNFAALTQFAGTPSSLALQWNTGGTNTSVSVSGIPLNRMFSHAGTVPGPGGTCVMYKDGLRIATKAFGASNPTILSTAQLCIDFDYEQNNRYLNAITNVGYIWNRSLSDVEHAEMDRDPYALLLMSQQMVPISISGLKILPPHLMEMTVQ